MVSLINGKELLDEYYRIAPIVVSKINNSKNPEIEYKMMLDEILDIVSKIESNNQNLAVSAYTLMFDRLKNTYA